MSTSVRTRSGRTLAAVDDVTPAGHIRCLICRVFLQRTATGDLADGVLEHYKIVHPNHPRS